MTFLGSIKVLQTAAGRLSRVAERPKIGYLGSPNNGNLGDLALYEAAQHLFQNRIQPLGFVGHERVLSRVGLSGAKYFNSMIVGGGTFFNKHAHNVLEFIHETKVPAWSVGTGVGDWGTKKDEDLSFLRPYLSQFREVGVRGPRSARKLEQLGLKNFRVTGDLALAFTVDSPFYPPCKKKFGVVAIAEHWPDMRIPLISAVQALMKEGWEPVPISFWRNDKKTLEIITKTVGVGARFFTPTSHQEYFEILRDCSFILATRLHSAVLATCVGTPPMVFAYSEKSNDFMESMDLKDWVVGWRGLSNEQAVEFVLDRVKAVDAERNRIWKNAYRFRLEIEAFVSKILNAI